MELYKFTRNDIFVNTLRLNPEVKFTIYNGAAYYNNMPSISGAYANPIRLTTPANISLYELNIDRGEVVTGRDIGPSDVADTGLIYPWIVKDGSRMNFRTSTTEAFVGKNPGDIIKGKYPLTATVGQEYYTNNTPRYAIATINSATGITNSGSISHLLALETTSNYYRYLSPHFQYSSSADMVSAGIHNRDFGGVGEWKIQNANGDVRPVLQASYASVGLVKIPSIFYGSEIKKGTIKLDIYYTGSLVATAQDTKRNGELIQTVGDVTGGVVGLALYKEGFLILTGAAALNGAQDNYNDGANDNPKWVYFGQSLSASVSAASTVFVMSMSGSTSTQVVTMLATAPKGELNHSNNPTYLKYSSTSSASSGSAGYIENDQIQIKNVVSSAYNDPTGSFEKTTYISSIGVYDKNKKLIGIAKVATPIKKTINRDFTFKLKLDI